MHVCTRASRHVTVLDCIVVERDVTGVDTGETSHIVEMKGTHLL